METWRATYAGILPESALARMREKNHRSNWSNLLQGHRSALREGELVLVAEEAKAGVVGFVSAGRTRSAISGYDGEIYTLYVAPDFQNRGVGAKLLTGTFRKLEACQIHSVMLWVLARNPSRFFYEAAGGAIVATRKERFWGVVLPELAYGWPDLARALNRSSDGAKAD